MCVTTCRPVFPISLKYVCSTRFFNRKPNTMWCLYSCIHTFHIWCSFAYIDWDWCRVLLCCHKANERNRDFFRQQQVLWVTPLHFCVIDNFPNLIRAFSPSSSATSLILLICFMSVRLPVSALSLFSATLSPSFSSLLTEEQDERRRLKWRLHNPFSWF